MRDKRIYFLRPVGQLGPVKIGCSCFPEGRLDTFTLWSPQKLELVVSVAGGHADERALHGLFKAHHLHGEWFGASKELQALIAYCVAHGELPELPTVVKFPATRHKAHSAQRPKPLDKRAWASAIRAEYEIGATCTQLAEKHEIAPVTALRMVRFAGGKTRSRGMAATGPRDMARAADIAKRYLGGQTLQTIATHYGVSRERVRQVLKKLGIDGKNAGPRRERIRANRQAA